jgi:SAM-dependent methyltransferase
VDDSRHYWNRHAASDPLWAVCSFPDKAGGRWDLQEFMQSGEREIALLFHRLGQLGLTVTPGAALDFGCGVGRLSQALARRFDRVFGIDVSDGMIDLAAKLNRYDGRVKYFANTAPDLRHFESRAVHFVYSNIVLQHMEPSRIRIVLADLLRVLRPGGLLVFQLPSHTESAAEAEIRPMPPAAYRARVELSDLNRFTAGDPRDLTVMIENISSEAWRQAEIGSLQAGNRWFDAAGKLLVMQDDGRAVIPQVMGAGERCETRLTVTPPAAGEYWLEVDLVHEGIAWFSDRGSVPVRVAVTVAEAAAASAAPPVPAPVNELPIPPYDATLIPKPSPGQNRAGLDEFPMYGIVHHEVVDLMTEHKATVVQIDEDRRAGDEWKSFRYFVRSAST